MAFDRHKGEDLLPPEKRAILTLALSNAPTNSSPPTEGLMPQLTSLVA
jgi:hypothetical protein